MKEKIIDKMVKEPVTAKDLDKHFFVEDDIQPFRLVAKDTGLWSLGPQFESGKGYENWVAKNNLTAEFLKEFEIRLKSKEPIIISFDEYTPLNGMSAAGLRLQKDWNDVMTVNSRAARTFEKHNFKEAFKNVLREKELRVPKKNGWVSFKTSRGFVTIKKRNELK